MYSRTSINSIEVLKTLKIDLPYESILHLGAYSEKMKSVHESVYAGAVPEG